MNIPGEGGSVGESIGGGGWCFGEELGSLWGGSVANCQCALWHSTSNNSECVQCVKRSLKVQLCSIRTSLVPSLCIPPDEKWSGEP